MKYLKTYEDDWEYHYEIGDYVHLEDLDWMVYLDAKIIDKNSNQNKIPSFVGEEPLNDYYIEAQIKTNNRIDSFWVDFDDIERKSTPKEIEEYKLRKDANKYNL